MEDATRRLVDTTLIGEAVESLPLAVFVTDASLNYLAVNAAAAELVGLPRGRLLELRVPDVVARPYEELRQAAQAAEAGDVVTGEVELRRADGSLLEVQHTTMRAGVGGLPVLVSFVRPKDPAALSDVLADALAHRGRRPFLEAAGQGFEP